MIGIFDSGVGGLSILQEVIDSSLEDSLVYFADQAHSPYGSKSQIYIQDRSEKITKYLTSLGCTSIVVACNTATLVTPIDFLRHQFQDIKFIGVEPPYNLMFQNSSKVDGLLITTQATKKILENKFQSNNNLNFKILAAPSWVDFVENYFSDLSIGQKEITDILDEYFDSNVKYLGLGCTHFNFLSKQIEQIYPYRYIVIDTSKAVVKQLIKQHKTLDSVNNKDVLFITSGDAPVFANKIKDLLNLDAQVQSIQL